MKVTSKLERAVLQEAPRRWSRPGRFDADYRIPHGTSEVLDIHPDGRHAVVLHLDVGLVERLVPSRSCGGLFAKPLLRRDRIEGRLQSAHGDNRMADVDRVSYAGIDVT